MPASRSAEDAFLRIEAGPDMRGPAPARRAAFPLWAVRAIFLAMITGTLLVGLGVLGRKV